MSSTNRPQRSLSLNQSRQLRRSRRHDSTPRTQQQQQQQQPSPMATRCLQSDIEAEDALFQAIETLIHRFLTRHGRRTPYHTTMRWSVNSVTVASYNVMIKIDQPSRHH